jgi:hypothetical protein
MTYPRPAAAQIESFRTHGWLIVADAIPAADLDRLEAECDQVLSEKERVTADWAWDVREAACTSSTVAISTACSLIGWSRACRAPHMTTANTSRRWRKAISNHMQVEGTGGEGDQYPRRVHVNQQTGERVEIGRILAQRADE